MGRAAKALDGSAIVIEFVYETDVDSDGNKHPVIIVLVDGHFECQVADNASGREYVSRNYGWEDFQLN